MKGDAFNPDSLRLPDNQIKTVRVTPRKILKRRRNYVQFPATWAERLDGASGQTWHLAWHLLHRHWKNNCGFVKLANGMLEEDGISRPTKWRALRQLERRGLIAIESRPRKSPIIRLLDGFRSETDRSQF